MDRNNYQLCSNSCINKIELDQKADRLMDNIIFLSNERNYAKSFPQYSTIDYSSIDEEELIMHIEELEKLYKEAKEQSKWGYLHNNAHPYLVQWNMDAKEYQVHPNEGCGTDQITSAPITTGKTALNALINAWKMWSIPPVLVLNADYYVPGISISEVAL